MHFLNIFLNISIYKNIIFNIPQKINNISNDLYIIIDIKTLYILFYALLLIYKFYLYF